MKHWKNFTEEELKCRCGLCNIGSTYIDPILMNWVQTIRTELDFPFPITSAARCHTHDNKFGGKRSHTRQEETGYCHALDIALTGKRFSNFLKIAMASNELYGIGIKQHGDYSSRFIHIDNKPSRDRNYKVIWSYP